jgi:hypothetical protein
MVINGIVVSGTGRQLCRGSVCALSRRHGSVLWHTRRLGILIGGISGRLDSLVNRFVKFADRVWAKRLLVTSG